MQRKSKEFLAYNRIAMMLCGTILYSFGINQLQILNYGLGSFDSLTLQIAKLTPIAKFGNASFLIHFTFFIILLLLVKTYHLDRKMIFLSILSIFILTRFVNLFSHLTYYPSQSILVLAITFLILNMGLFLLAKSNFIIAPFDKFLVETSNHFNINFGIVRFIADLLILAIVMIINIFSGQIVPITIFTIMITLLTGINISIYEFGFNKIIKINASKKRINIVEQKYKM